MPKPMRDIYNPKLNKKQSMVDNTECKKDLQKWLKSLNNRWRHINYIDFDNGPSIISVTDEDTKQFLKWQKKAEALSSSNDIDGFERALNFASFYLDVIDIICDISEYYRYNLYRNKRGGSRWKSWDISYENQVKWAHRLLREEIEKRSEDLEKELESLKKYVRICRISDRKNNLKLLGISGYSSPTACPAFEDLERLSCSSSWEDILSVEHDILAVENDHLIMRLLEIIERMSR